MSSFGFKKRTKQAVVAGCAVLTFSVTAHADAFLDDAVAFNGTILHLQTDVPGLIVGAVRDGDTAIAGFGETQPNSGIVPDGDTVFRIGSITKVFAGEMLAHAVARDEVAFTDPATQHLTGRLGDALTRHPPMRLIDLTTHAAGLPREVPRADSPPDDPFATITHDAFADWLDDNDLLFSPGSSIAYSNFGFDLLSTALSEAGSAPYRDLLADRITEPLGMSDTGFDLTEAMKNRLMTGHAPDGTPLPNVPSGQIITGSGGLHSTANDLLRWMQWHLGQAGPDAEVRFLDHAVYVQRDAMNMVLSMDESGRMDAMGLGWVAMNPTAQRPFILQKAGALQGQMSYIAFAPDHGTAVFVSINQFDFAAAYAMTEFANAFLATLSGY
ncbi:D-alanyl-D-alanine-carboxypeptidase/endopeptidase AmpH [uncultured Aliiroseovarius sp.]|uniref:D-alanyl-D-alanine- carboxypeptidase/endopeptidase AmpH n=1 Tax=uncultured Aliiroseovarius sp. TaxID=1658783 RepID=UPI0025977C02|nr:D-alanyl-D-alanine-carboxypeptidase/endopeptidase AmpH [uncultured Aliiroseovarius sp.]